ncbi:MAG: SAM-dependent methyltransferase [Acidobacteriota bacterium]
MSFLRTLLFVLFEVLLAPLQLLGSLVYAFRIRFLNRARGISGTAYEPFMARWALHLVGSRCDEGADRISPHLSALSPFVRVTLMHSIAAAARWSGYRGSFFAYPGPRPSPLMVMVSHRTHFFDRAMAAATRAESPVRQVVVLGAGWDTRSYGVSPEGPDLEQWFALGERSIFEVDEPPTQQHKIEALRGGSVDAEHVVFAPTNFNQHSWLDSLEAHGFDRGRPSFVLWEGVTMYLDDATVDETLGRIAGLPAGTQVAFDFLSRELVLAQKPFRIAGNYARLGLGGFYGESWHFGLSTKQPVEDGVRSFVEERGLKLSGFETFGRETERRPVIGGLVLAEVA